MFQVKHHCSPDQFELIPVLNRRQGSLFRRQLQGIWYKGGTHYSIAIPRLQNANFGTAVNIIEYQFVWWGTPQQMQIEHLHPNQGAKDVQKGTLRVKVQ